LLLLIKPTFSPLSISYGKVAVVIVVGLIMIATFVMNAISYKIAKSKEEKENAKENSDKNADQN